MSDLAHHHPLPTPVSAARLTLDGAPSQHHTVVHDFMALGFVTAGEAVVTQRERYSLQAGDVCLVPAGVRHGLVAARSASAWGVRFDPACAEEAALGALLGPFARAASGGAVVVRIPAGRREHLASLCSSLNHETTSASREAHGAIVQRSLLALVLTEIARASEATAVAGLQPTLVGDALRFIERRCLGPVSLSDVAAAVHRSPSHVATAVKGATGRTVGEWITAGRLAEARRRLVHTDEWIDIIAERVGYMDPTHFIRVFRRAYGATPAAWRAAQRRAWGSD